MCEGGRKCAGLGREGGIAEGDGSSRKDGEAQRGEGIVEC